MDTDVIRVLKIPSTYPFESKGLTMENYFFFTTVVWTIPRNISFLEKKKLVKINYFFYLKLCKFTFVFSFLILLTDRIKSGSWEYLQKMTGLSNFFCRKKVESFASSWLKKKEKRKKAIFKNNKHRKLYENISHLKWGDVFIQKSIQTA